MQNKHEGVARLRSTLVVVSFVLAAMLAMVCPGCRAPGPTQKTIPDAAAEEVSLGRRAGFDAYLIHQGDVGIWTVECTPIFEHCGCPQVVALDDKGRCTILNSYSGKWTPSLALQDGEWLGGFAHGDVDPHRPGMELYVGGKRGNLYQVLSHRQGGFDSNLIDYFPGEEIHTIAAEDLDASNPGAELLVFTSPGNLYVLTATEDGSGRFKRIVSMKLPGRVRDAIVIPGNQSNGKRLATVSRDGAVRILFFEGNKPVWKEIFRTAMGLGRIASTPRMAGEPSVFYVTCDDGRIIRLAEQTDESFSSEIIHAGPQGPRGIAAGRFHADPDIEAVAIFGYSKDVQLISHIDEAWHVETIFEDIDKGHWLTAAELDGRNATNEIVLSGYGSRVVLLMRPPGYGLSGSKVAPGAPKGAP